MDLMEGILWLALNIYFEARNQPERGQYAVAHVTLNRANQNNMRIKDVVLEPGQFSWVKQRKVKGSTDVVKLHVAEKKAFSKALQIAMSAYVTPDPTDGATHYHASYVRPKWANKLKRKTKIGQHIFYAVN